MTEKKKVYKNDVWASKHRRSTVVSAEMRHGMLHVKFRGTTGAIMSAWEDNFVRNRTLIERDGKPVDDRAG